MSIELHKAVNTLIDALRNDPAYYESWKSNIAVRFQDACTHREKGGVYNWHEISNEAADKFLRILCG